MTDALAREPDDEPGSGAPTDTGEYGPGGYLPPRAAARARKIVLREQMGIHWPIAAVVAGLAIVAITLPLVLWAGQAPSPPFTDVGPIAMVPADGSAFVETGDVQVLVVRGTGGLLAFLRAPADAGFCQQSRRIEDGSRAWTTQGRLVIGDGESLQPVEITAYEGRLFVDVTRPRPAPQPQLGTQQVSC